ncbi:MAG: YicC family protein [Hymenobacteraceae bacterium]|nr:YicC family protein [Hymenobacteraceae bacterium]MDX5511276.1 YicC family protein [Hymenobacteraceae bacterium]
MTGYGASRLDAGQYTITVEVKSLNSKGLDVTLRLPRFLADKEVEVRNMITKSLIRGKVNMCVDVSENKAAGSKNFINKDLLKTYYTQLEEAADLLNAPKTDLFRLALHMPDVLQQEQSAAEEGVAIEWEQVLPLVQEALLNLNHFRNDEGKALTNEIVSYVDRIRILLAEVDKHDPVRVENIRNRIKNHVSDISSSEHFDMNRFEQEMIYYIEKLDIAEEKVRLVNHLHFFTETFSLPEPTGKNFVFFAQELGREINTIGSKANDSTIQHYVVEMKEELEKIKEQINNVL